MHRSQPLPPRLLDLAALQDYVLTREQALGHGFNQHAVRRLVIAGAWQRVAPGVFFTSSTQVPWRAQAWAGVLIGGDYSRLGGRAAGYLHGLVDAPPADIDVWWGPGSGRPRIDGPWLFHRESSPQRGASVGIPPRLSVEDTVLDLIADQDVDSRQVIALVTAAVQSRRTTAARFRRAIGRRRFVAHRRLLEKLLAEVAEGVRSPLEHDYLVDVEQPHGLPRGVRQRGRRNTEVDVWYEDYGLLVELDGRLGHEGVGRFRDMARDNAATADGLASLRYGHHDVTGRPCLVALEVAGVLTQRGWTGLVERCRRCARASGDFKGSLSRDIA